MRRVRGGRARGGAPHDCTACEVRRLALFQALPLDVLRTLERLRRETRVVAARQAVVAIDRAPAELFTVYRGWAFSYRMTQDGRRQIVDFHLPGDLIGLESLGSAPVGVGIEALTPAALCVFGTTELMAAAGEVAALGAALAWMASRHEARLSERLTDIGRRSAADRVAHLLLELWTRQRWREPEVVGDCLFPLSNQHIGDALGLSPEHVSRTLGGLRQAGLAFVARGRLRLPAPGLLAAKCDWTADYLRPRPLL